MTTKRERAEAKAARRREWAEARRAKAAALEAKNAPFVGDHAFNTQPGIIPERTRANRRSEKAHDHARVADYLDAKADGIERRLDRSIFDDDPDAIERLRERIAGLEAERARVKEWNAAHPLDRFPPYKLANLGADIRRNRKRLEGLEATS